ncbi:hypothetical protein GALMADRAFT_240158 [Galerina marginata CBS 339.88]|uniref:F-box domain-containing protein n=1 Tax=Galerina marginata (strain CBS 339.88) TaxID=685588 RepID=A0A067TF95_GALM3|nr:hypothetical protein GALMADRAFT_240158 [Galerina marginata CBS 339.88]
MAAKLVYDLIVRVMELCHDDYGLLAQCALVNWEFNRAASRMLYSKVVLSPHFKPVLDLRDAGAIPESSNFASASLPRNVQYVLALEVSGYISPRPPPRNTLPERITKALVTFVNLVSVRYTPVTYHENLFDQSIPTLHNLRSLVELTVNASCTDDVRAPAIVELTGLRKLTLYNPGRAILQLLPKWLERLQATLVELHLRDNCGSVTPGVLKSFLPYLENTVQAFTLGLSYSLTDNDVFTFLGQITRLKRLELRYYWQLKPPQTLPNLLSLRSFTVTYPPQYTRKEVDEFDKWVRRTIAGSLDLQTLTLYCEGRDASIYLSHNSLVGHITQKHATSLRYLDLALTFVGMDKLEDILTSCTQLEEIALQMGKNGLTLFRAKVSGLKQLRTASFQIRNVPRTYQMNIIFLTEIMDRGQPSLRRLSLNNISWEVSEHFIYGRCHTIFFR